ncbi:MAG: hypothetical protein ACI8PZ_005612 [Myxococcota bacterium]|jgi:hypothetical protein
MLVLVLFACSVLPQDPGLTPADFDLETAETPSAPPTLLSLTGPAVAEPGGPVRFEVGGALEGERAWLLVGGEEAPGAGPCASVLGGYCLDLTRPVGIYDSAIADAEGVATIDTDAPIWPGASACFQVVVMRGPAGVFSGLSDVVCMTACDEGDTDGDGVCDEFDLCPGEDDTLDDDADGTPDGCQRKLLAGTGVASSWFDYYYYYMHGGAGPLYSIDLDTGVVTHIMDTNYAITGLTTGPDDTIYAIAGGARLDPLGGNVYTIDLEARTTTLLAAGDEAKGSLEMVDDMLWVVSEADSCLTIDPDDGTRTVLPGVPDGRGTGHALAWDGDVLWRVAANSLYTLDADCEQTVVALPGAADYRGGGATWYRGELYLVYETELFTINTITGERTGTGIEIPYQADALTVAPIGF